MGERDAAQADQLIRALCDVRDDMIRQLSWLGDSQLESAALRREINEAQTHVNRLQHRYLRGIRTPPRSTSPPTGSLIQAGRIRFLRVDSINAKHRGGIHAAENLSDTQKLPVPA